MRSGNKPERHAMNPPAQNILLMGGDPQWLGTVAFALQPDNLAPEFASNAERGAPIARAEAGRNGGRGYGIGGDGGFELLRRIKEHPPANVTLLIVVTAADDTATQLRAFELGALDCISKSTETALLRARLLAALKMKRRAGGMNWRNRELTDARRPPNPACEPSRIFWPR